MNKHKQKVNLKCLCRQVLKIIVLPLIPLFVKWNRKYLTKKKNKKQINLSIFYNSKNSSRATTEEWKWENGRW